MGAFKQAMTLTGILGIGLCGGCAPKPEIQPTTEILNLVGGGQLVLSGFEVWLYSQEFAPNGTIINASSTVDGNSIHCYTNKIVSNSRYFGEIEEGDIGSFSNSVFRINDIEVQPEALPPEVFAYMNRRFTDVIHFDGFTIDATYLKRCNETLMLLGTEKLIIDGQTMTDKKGVLYINKVQFMDSRTNRYVNFDVKTLDPIFLKKGKEAAQ